MNWDLCFSWSKQHTHVILPAIVGAIALIGRVRCGRWPTQAEIVDLIVNFAGFYGAGQLLFYAGSHTETDLGGASSALAMVIGGLGVGFSAMRSLAPIVTRLVWPRAGEAVFQPTRSSDQISKGSNDDV